MQRYFVDRTDEEGRIPTRSDQQRAFDLAASILTMVDCACGPESFVLLEGHSPAPWRDTVSISAFLGETFRETYHPLLYNEDETLKEPSIMSNLSATSLIEKANLQFMPTNNLRNHLLLDSINGIVQVFHLTAVLKEF